MLRVLHLSYDDPRNPWVGGGGAVRAFEIYRRLADRLDVTIATGSYPGARDEAIEGVRYVRLGATRPYLWSRWTYARAATRLLARADYDAAVYDYSAYTPIRLPRGRPVGISVGQLAGPTARQRWGAVLGGAVAAVERRLLRSARVLSAVSAWLLERLRPLAAPGARLMVVGAGVPEDLFGIERREQGYLLFYGRFDIFQKGIDTLLEAMALLVRDRPELELRIAGRGKDAGRIHALARELDLERSIRVHEGVDEATRAALFSGALALLMPSRFEGFGMVAAEAMAAGVPLVASAVDALPEVVGAPEGGVLVPPDDPGALAAATKELLCDPERRRSLSRSARLRARRFSWDGVARDHLTFVRTIAAGTNGAHPLRGEP